MVSKTLEEFCGNLVSDWKKYKKEAIKTNNFESYHEFLKTVQAEFSKLYAKVTKPRLISLVEQVLKTATCEIKEIMIKYKRIKKELPF